MVLHKFNDFSEHQNTFQTIILIVIESIYLPVNTKIYTNNLKSKLSILTDNPRLRFTYI